MAGLCELCATDHVLLQSTVVVQHAHGGSLQFAACERCTRAMRRLAASLGSEGRMTGLRQIGTGDTHPETGLRPTPVADVRSTEVLAKVEEHIIGPDGTRYLVEICGGLRSDGMWSGWIEFEAIGDGGTRRTGQETTQSTREDLMYWASGLGPAFFEGAFDRTH